ncbi:hypothetical protein [Burkholderia sp. LMG 13014]|uniref:hypothetical protein n=1 Tax=Burkholderia sp. LMG 13014 TaxID=2709306 RepID=UPI001F05592E|nr:hypothetical protein [Burkholderia sp. LMG 13014]
MALSAWYPGHWHVLLLLLSAVWSRVRGRASALAIWMSNYLAGARDIPVVCMRFFSGYGEMRRPEAFVLGFLFWIAQACVLAAPWAVLKPKPNAGAARYALCATVATVLVTYRHSASSAGYRRHTSPARCILAGRPPAWYSP